MEWVEGKSLARYVEEHLEDRDALTNLASRWIQMIEALQGAGIAHGDLQHGNVLVVGDTLKLIDYDGMYVPELEGETSNEIGHPNYQHPSRAPEDFGPYLDSFPGWVIYLSLLALSVDPNLWSKLSCGDDTLLLRKQDFEHPDRSRALQMLERVQDPRVESVVSLLRSFLNLRPEQIPALSGSVQPPPDGVPPVRAGGMPDWITDHVQLNDVALTRSKVSKAITHCPSPALWVMDYVTPANPSSLVDFQGPVTFARWWTLSSSVLALVLLFASMAGTLPPWIAAGACVLTVGLAAAVVLGCYAREPVVVQARDARDRVRKAEQESKTVRSQEAGLRRRRADAESEFLMEASRLRAKLDAVESRERAAVRRTTTIRKNLLSSLQLQQNNLSAAETEALAKVAAESLSRLRQIDDELGALARQEAEEIAAALKDAQNKHITSVLSSARLLHASLPRIWPDIRNRLIAGGYRTAADINAGVDRVRGVGPKRKDILMDWRRSEEAKARASMPRRLPPSTESAIRSKYAGRRTKLEEDRRREPDRKAEEEARIRRDHQTLRASLADREKTERAQLRREEQEIAARYAPQHRLYKDALERLERNWRSNSEALDARLAELHEMQWKCEWARAQASSDLAQYRRITLTGYLRRIVRG